MDFEQIVATTGGGDSGAEFARKINDNFSKVNSKIITIDSEIEDLQQNGGGGGSGGDDPSPPSGGDSVLITTVPELDIIETTLPNGNIKIEMYAKEDRGIMWGNTNTSGQGWVTVVEYCSLENYHINLPNGNYYLTSQGEPSRASTAVSANLEDFCLIYTCISGNTIDDNIPAPTLRINGVLYRTSYGHENQSFTVRSDEKIYETIITPSQVG